MCGIIGVAGALTPVQAVIFKELLHADVVRGKHSTGIALAKGSCNSVSTFKMAYPSPVFLELPTTVQELSNFSSNVVAIGHNRHATKGNPTDPLGAHPFTHGNITLVHNGSLNSHSHLTKEKFIVDSEAICKAISEDGIEVVGPKLNGAYVLVWIDSALNTLNFFRNSERPLGIAWDIEDNMMYWASESDMLKWSLNRSTFTRTPITNLEHFEFPIGRWLSIPITSTGIDLAEREWTYITEGVEKPNVVEYDFPTAAATTDGALATNNASGEKVTEYKFGVTRERALQRITDRLIDRLGACNMYVRAYITTMDMTSGYVVLDERVAFEITSFIQDPRNPSRGTMNGLLLQEPFSQVEICNYPVEAYNSITGCYVTSYLAGIAAPSDGCKVIAGRVQQGQAKGFTLRLRGDSLLAADWQPLQQSS